MSCLRACLCHALRSPRLPHGDRVGCERLLTCHLGSTVRASRAPPRKKVGLLPSSTLCFGRTPAICPLHAYLNSPQSSASSALTAVAYVVQAKEKLGIVAGQELPRRGRCAHYAKSYRWFRSVARACGRHVGVSAVTCRLTLQQQILMLQQSLPLRQVGHVFTRTVAVGMLKRPDAMAKRQTIQTNMRTG